MVGGLAYLSSLAVLVFLVEVVGVHYIVAMLISLAFVTVAGHALHRRATFGSGGAYLGEFFRYNSVVLLQFGLGLGLMIVLVELAGLSYLVANFLAAGVLAALSFVAHRTYTFRKKERISRSG